VLATTPAWPPTRMRVQASLDALAELCRVQQNRVGLLPLFAAELSNALTARTAGGDAYGRKPFYFEVVEQLRDEVEEQHKLRAEVEGRLHRAEGEAADRRTLVEQAQISLRRAEAALAEHAARDTVASGKLKAAKAECGNIAEEKHALEVKLASMEESWQRKEDELKEAQVRLYVEEKRNSEQLVLFKEKRALLKASAHAARNQMTVAQHMLLRAHHASLRAEGKGSETFELATLPVAEQIAEAMSWAEALPAVKAESDPKSVPMPAAANQALGAMAKRSATSQSLVGSGAGRSPTVRSQ